MAIKFVKPQIVNGEISEVIDINDLGIYAKTTTRGHKVFCLDKSTKALEQILNENKILQNEELKIISYSGGYASIAFINAVCQKETIEELYASTLRVGNKQLNVLNDLANNGKIHKANFVIGGIMRDDNSYGYFTNFDGVCKKNGWRFCVLNNHSKIILMKTKDNFYVLETSSNLNENPKIEQFNFMNDETIYNFYKSFFEKLLEMSKNGNET